MGRKFLTPSMATGLLLAIAVATCIASVSIVALSGQSLETTPWVKASPAGSFLPVKASSRTRD